MSDDEFDDLEFAFEVNDELFTAISTVESHYARQASQPVLVPPIHVPPVNAQAGPSSTRNLQTTKRRLSRNTNPPPPARKDNDGDSIMDEVLPEIVLLEDGSYALGGHTSLNRVPPPPTALSIPKKIPAILAPRVVLPPPRPIPRPTPPSVPVPIPPVRHVPSQPPLAPSSRVNKAVAGPSRRTKPISHTNASSSPVPSPSPIPAPLGRNVASSSRPVTTAFPPQVTPEIPGPHVDPREYARLQESVNVLNAQIAELNQTNEAMQKSLKEAKNANFSRQGEITTVRRAMEKQAATHAEALGKLRAEKAAAEQQRISTQAALSAEMDRLKTRLTFKQQEIEASNRKHPMAPPSTIRRRRPPPPSQSQQESSIAGPSWSASQQRSDDVFLDDSPSKGKSKAKKLSPRKQENRLAVRKPEPIPFKGFHNTFEPQATSTARRKGKERAVDEPSLDTFQAFSQPSPSQIERPQAQTQASQEQWGQQYYEMQEVASSPVKVFEGGDSVHEDSPNTREHEPEVVNWSEELHRLVFTHCLPPRRPNEESQLTLQILMSTTILIPSDDDDDHANLMAKYVRACGNLLSSFGNIEDTILANVYGQGDGYEDMVTRVGGIVLQLVDILAKAGLTITLHPLLQLVKSLILSLPSFRAFFLAPVTATGDMDGNPRRTLLTIIYDLTTNGSLSVKPPPPPPPPLPKALQTRSGEDLIVADALDIMDAMQWTVTDALVPNMSLILDKPTMVMTLLEPSRPYWMILRTLRLLTYLCTHSHLATIFLGTPGAPDWRPPFVNQLCMYLATSPGHWDRVEALELKKWMLAVISTLATTHEQSVFILEHYTSLLPSLVLCLGELSNWIWEEEESVVAAAPKLNEVTVVVLGTAVQLLYHLFYCKEGMPDLAPMLKQAPPVYHGLTHIFIVCMARIGYCDAPAWLGVHLKGQIDDISDMARELLESFADGPEADLIVSAYLADYEEIGASQETQDEVQQVQVDPSQRYRDKGKGKQKEQWQEMEGVEEDEREDGYMDIDDRDL